jgi:hypothetical protein
LSEHLPDPDRFPSDIKALVDYAHSKGLKIGIYEDYGTKTCGGYPGSLEYLELDANTFAEWEVDYVKFDGCNSNPFTLEYGYLLFGYYLNKTNRPMVYSCEWPWYQIHSLLKPNYPRVAEVCNLWRKFHDVSDIYDSSTDIMSHTFSNQDQLPAIQGPGAWNDPDMLLIGNFGLNYAWSQAQMALWSILAAPLIMSVDLRTIEPQYRDILLNRNLIAIRTSLETWANEFTVIKGFIYEWNGYLTV